MGAAIASSHRSHAARPEDGNQAGKNGADRHQLWPEPMDSTLNGGLVNIGVCERATCRDALAERFVQIQRP